ncbi:MAG: hypothetical protein ACXACI_01745 [Candidatus Hodarchaeales archaeon]|jgi:hypothetical protein
MSQNKEKPLKQSAVCACERSVAEAQWHSANELLIVFRDQCYECATRKQILAAIRVEDIKFKIE